MSQTNEQALEVTIEKRLTGTTLETLKTEGLTVDMIDESGALCRTGKGYYMRQPHNFNAQFAIELGKIKPKDPESDSKKFTMYIPYWV